MFGDVAFASIFLAWLLAWQLAWRFGFWLALTGLLTDWTTVSLTIWLLAVCWQRAASELRTGWSSKKRPARSPQRAGSRRCDESGGQSQNWQQVTADQNTKGALMDNTTHTQFVLVPFFWSNEYLYKQIEKAMRLLNFRLVYLRKNASARFCFKFLFAFKLSLAL